MPWSPEMLSDGETPGVTKINTLFTGFRTYVNGLDRDALKLGALNVDQTPTIIPTGNPVFVAHNDDNSHTYLDTTFTTSLRYTTHGANGGTETSGSYTGDRAIIGHPDVGGGSTPPKAKVTLNSGTGYLVGNNGSDKVSGILAFFNVDVVNIINSTTDCDAMVCLQFKHSGSATWWTLPKTERFVSKNDHKIISNAALEGMWVDVPIRTFIGADQVTAVGGTPATHRVTDIRAMCSLKNGIAGTAVLHLGSFRLSAVPLLAQVL